MKKMQAQYGKKKGENVYFAMEQKGKIKPPSKKRKVRKKK
jgi:hypothetical protein